MNFITTILNIRSPGVVAVLGFFDTVGSRGDVVRWVQHRWDRILRESWRGGGGRKGRKEGRREGGERVSLGSIALILMEILGEGGMVRESFWSDLISRLPIHAHIQQCSRGRIMLVV